MIKEETLNVLRGIVLIDSRMPQRCKTAVRRYFRTIELPENKAFEQPYAISVLFRTMQS